MIRIRKGNPKLIRAIIASFGEPAETTRMRMASFTSRDWKRTEFWLDTSGLALYFMQHIHTHDLSDAIDKSVLTRLRAKQEDNRLRSEDMMREFAALNRAFLDAGVRFANLKGFTLSPHSCPDPALRHQSDHDFLVDHADVAKARALLEERGFMLSGSNRHTLEFKMTSDQPGSLDRQYEARQPRSAELHIATESLDFVPAQQPQDECLGRVILWHSIAGTFPALLPADQLIGQALHLLGHLRNENTRPSWLLEFRNHVLFRRNDSLFWIEVKRAAEGHSDIALALGLSILLATELFGPFSFESLDAWTVDVLPEKVRYWAETYGRRAVLADIPGTKLYLLLNSALREDVPAREDTESRRRRFPLRLPPRIMQPPAKDTLGLRIRREIVQIEFIWFRLRFHLKQGFLYALEARRWKRCWSEGRRSSFDAEVRAAWRDPAREASKMGDMRSDVKTSA